MDTAKATINIKEGLIQLEGTQEFVEKYLDKYQNIIQDFKNIPPPYTAPRSESDDAKTEEAPPKRTRTRASKTKGTASCMGRIRTLVNEDYFKEPRTSTEVMNWLKEQKGATYTSGPITAALNQLIKSNTLRRFKEGKGLYKYCNP